MFKFLDIRVLLFLLTYSLSVLAFIDLHSRLIDAVDVLFEEETFAGRPTIANVGSQMDIASGSKLSLNCTGNGTLFWVYPNYSKFSEKAKISKFKNNNTFGSNLEIENMKYIDTGKYQCCLYEEKIENCRLLFVYVNDPEHIFLPENDLINVHHNEETIIPCRPTVSNINVTLWKRNEMLDLDDENVLYEPRIGFTIYNSTSYFSGLFICKAKYKNVSQELLFDLVYDYHNLQPPTIYPISSVIDIPRGSDIEIKCSGEKPVEWIYPYPEISFFDFRWNIIKSGDDELKQDVSYHITRTIVMDSTPFLCCYENYKCDLNKTASATYLRVNDPDQLYVPLRLRTIMTEELQCIPYILQCIPSMPNVTVELLYHYKNSSDAKIYTSSREDFSFNPIVGFIPNDFQKFRRENGSKTYFCNFRYQNTSQRVQKSASLLSPRYAIQMSASNENPFEKYEVEIICEACKFAFKNITLKWKGNDQKYATPLKNVDLKDLEFRDESTNYNMKHVWKFPSISSKNNGKYECVGITQDNVKEEQSLNLKVKAIEKPEFIKTNMNGTNVTVALGKEFEFLCIVHGEPIPTVTWYKNNQIINETNSIGVNIYKNQLKVNIMRVSRSHSGTYKCEAENKGGVIFAEMTLNQNFIIEEKSNTEANIKRSTSSIVLAFTILCVILGISLVIVIYLIVKNKLRNKRLYQPAALY